MVWANLVELKSQAFELIQMGFELHLHFTEVEKIKASMWKIGQGQKIHIGQKPELGKDPSSLENSLNILL